MFANARTRFAPARRNSARWLAEACSTRCLSGGILDCTRGRVDERRRVFRDSRSQETYLLVSLSVVGSKSAQSRSVSTSIGLKELSPRAIRKKLASVMPGSRASILSSSTSVTVFSGRSSSSELVDPRASISSGERRGISLRCSCEQAVQVLGIEGFYYQTSLKALYTEQEICEAPREQRKQVETLHCRWEFLWQLAPL